MPIVKATIEGREYSFAPLSNRDARQLTKSSAKLVREGRADIFEVMDNGKPYVEISMKAAGSEMPDFEGLPFLDSCKVFEALMRGVMDATGLEHAPVGEAAPARTNGGTTSTVFSLPSPDGASTTSTDSPSTT